MTSFRLSLRGLLRTPLFTTTAILSLALGVGANGAMFSILDRVLLRHFPDLFVPIFDARRTGTRLRRVHIRQDDSVAFLFGRLKSEISPEHATAAINVAYRAQLEQDIAELRAPSEASRPLPPTPLPDAPRPPIRQSP